MTFNLYDRQYHLIDINTYEDEIMRCQKVSIIVAKHESGCCGSESIFFHIVLRDQNYIDKYLFVGTYDLKEQQMFINFKKPNNVNDIKNLCSGFPSIFEASKNYDKNESCCGCCCENIITPHANNIHGQQLIRHNRNDLHRKSKISQQPIQRH
jgi:hypothetical protein